MSLLKKAKLKLIWFTHCRHFAFSHKPLCSRFSEDVIHFSNYYFCRSCVFLYSGAIAATVALLFYNDHHHVLHLFIFLLLSLITIGLSFPPIYKKFTRKIRDLLRLLLGIVIVTMVYLAIFIYPLLGSIFLTAFLLTCYIYQRIRSGIKKNICNNCVEYNTGQTCSGFTLKKQKTLSYQKDATEYLLQSGYKPDIKK